MTAFPYYGITILDLELFFPNLYICILLTSDQTRLPAEFSDINKRKKRNEGRLKLAQLFVE